MSRVRTVFVPYLHAFGGVEREIVSLSRFLYAARIPHRVVCFDRTIDLQAYSDSPLDVIALRPRRQWMAEGRAFRSIFRRQDVLYPVLAYDLRSGFYAGLAGRSTQVIIHVDDSPSLLPRDESKYAWRARRAYPALRQFPQPGLRTALKAEIIHQLTGSGLRRAREVIVNTDSVGRELRAIYGVETTTIPIGVSSPRTISSRRTRRTGPLVLLSVSRLEATKRIDVILQALHRLARPGEALAERDWRMEIVGEGSVKSDLQFLASRLGLSNRVVFTGHVSDAELDELYEAADIFLMPAVQGYGLPALEALSRAIPVVVSQASGVREILPHSPWIEMASGDFEDFPRAISRLVERIDKDTWGDLPPPSIPSDDQWARSLCSVCGWLPRDGARQSVDVA